MSKILPLSLAVALALTACHQNENKAKQQDAEFVKIEAPIENGAVNMLLPDFVQLVAQEGGAVVNIRVVPKKNTNLNNFFSFEDFFRDWEGGEDSFGSGVIIANDGYILTNAHVVKDAAKIVVALSDRREFTAHLVGSDDKTDVALLKIDATDLPQVRTGNSDALKPGEWVAAIGAPFGFNHSVTSGIVSAKGRSLPEENYTPFIQTDVAINPGNSGGPLFNLKGEVVGINSQIYSRSGGFMGISFAIPIEIAMNVAEQLKQYGKVHRGQLGIIIQEINYDLAKAFGLEKPAGALVTRLLNDSPAAQAGLQVGDIILSANGQIVHFSHDLPVIIGAIAPGKEVPLNIWRKGENLELTVQLASLNSETPANSNDHHEYLPDTETKFSMGDLGLTIGTHNTGRQTQLIVLQAEGIAADSGFEIGDVLISINGQTITDQQSLENALAQNKHNVPILVQRSGNMLFISLNLP